MEYFGITKKGEKEGDNKGEQKKEKKEETKEVEDEPVEDLFGLGDEDDGVPKVINEQ